MPVAVLETMRAKDITSLRHQEVLYSRFVVRCRSRRRTCVGYWYVRIAHAPALSVNRLGLPYYSMGP